MVWLKALRGRAAFILHGGCAQKILQMGLGDLSSTSICPCRLSFEDGLATLASPKELCS